MSKTDLKFSYRPDIDGLRTIAVLAVVLFHADISLFKGGFVGVDIFFVISGFLITRILSQEIAQNHRIDFPRFYIRRARRLLPALLFTLTSTTVAALSILSSQALQSYGASLLHSMLSVSNIFFFSESGYFDTDSHLKPLLHTWSLAVEEQFYIFWPLLLLPLINRRTPGKALILLVGALSLISAQFAISAHPSAVFFLMPFRIFEFSIGAALVWLPARNKPSLIVDNSLLFAGLALLAYSIFFFDQNTAFPGVSALAPCLGTALCIYAKNPAFGGRLINNRPIVTIGLISYSLYLVHWPIVVFYKLLLPTPELLRHDKISIVALSIVLAALMYLLVEKPFRKQKTSNVRFLVTTLILSVSLCYTGASMWANNGWSWRPWISKVVLSNERIKIGMDKRFDGRRTECTAKGWTTCDIPEPGKTNALIIGDSHAADALNAFQALYPKQSFSMLEQGGCPPYADIESITPPTHPDREKCKALNVKRFDLDYLKQYNYIVINVLFGWYTPEHLKTYIDYLHSHGIQKVIVVGGYIVLNKSLPEILNEHGYSNAAVEPWVVDNRDIEGRIRKYAEDDGYLFLSKRDTFCNIDGCKYFDEHGVPFTYDQHHLSFEFSSKIATANTQLIEKYLDIQ
jgi:peptidoglycan/LPS O-acetylase OafA/YrhL